MFWNIVFGLAREWLYYEDDESQKFLEELFSLVKSSSKVYASLWSVLNERPPDVQNPFKNTLGNKLEPWELCSQTLASFLKKAWPKTLTFANGTEWKIFTDGALLLFSYNNHSSPTHGSKTKFCTKFFANFLSRK